MAFSIKGRLKSFTYAFAGFAFMLRTQHNAWVHLAATIVVAALGFALRISTHDWLWLIVAIALVWVAEAMNTAFEYLCDVVSPQFSEQVRRCKDIAASAVLICVIAAALIGALVFWPYLMAR